MKNLPHQDLHQGGTRATGRDADTESQQWTARVEIKHKTSNPSFWIKMLIWAVLSAEVDCLCPVKADGANRRTLMFLGHWSLPLTSLAAVVASCQIGGDKYGFQSAEIVVLWEDNFILKTAGLNFVILGDSYPTQISISHQLRVSKRRHAVLTSRDWNHCSGSSITLEKSLRATIWSILNPSIRPFSIPTLSCTQGVIPTATGWRHRPWTSHQFIADSYRQTICCLPPLGSI